jgi:hypothetical protein
MTRTTPGRCTCAIGTLLAALATGCSSSGSGSDASAPPQAAPPGPVTSVPDAWAPPADCNGVGNLCWNCGSGATCQLLGNVCVPSPDGPPTNRNEQTPYCLARVCMTYEQASCFCTGEAGALYASCQAGPAAVANLCATVGASCDSEGCCPGLACLKGSSSSTCYQTCAAGSDCSTGCCTDLFDDGHMECAPQAACQNPCQKHGGSCQQSSDCCAGECLTINPDGGPPYTCYPNCTGPSDCDAGCCGPIIGEDASACTPCQ